MRKRVNYNLTEDCHKQLRIIAAKRGISASALVLEIVESWLKRHNAEATETWEKPEIL